LPSVFTTNETNKLPARLFIVHYMYTLTSRWFSHNFKR
jgi:hypothetical protein